MPTVRKISLLLFKSKRVGLKVRIDENNKKKRALPFILLCKWMSAYEFYHISLCIVSVVMSGHEYFDILQEIVSVDMAGQNYYTISL